MKKKISAKKYAQLLLLLTSGKDQKEISWIVKNFVSRLKKDANLNLAEQITDEFEKMFLARQGKAKLEITSAFKLSADNRREIETLAERLLGEERFETSERLDERLKGGFILRSNNRVVNLSLENTLNNLERNLKA